MIYPCIQRTARNWNGVWGVAHSAHMAPRPIPASYVKIKTKRFQHSLGAQQYQHRLHVSELEAELTGMKWEWDSPVQDRHTLGNDTKVVQQVFRKAGQMLASGSQHMVVVLKQQK